MAFLFVKMFKRQQLIFVAFQLKPVEYLLGSTARLGDIIVLGLLTQLKEVISLLCGAFEICLITFRFWNCHSPANFLM